MSKQEPVWFYPGAPLGSAVKYIASLSPLFDWVGIYILKGERLELGPHIGTSPGNGCQQVIQVRDRHDRILGQIKIESRRQDAWGSEEELLVQKVAQELGELWPA